MVSGGPTQVHISPTTAAGILPINTLGTPGPTIGPPTCGTGEGNAGVWEKQPLVLVNATGKAAPEEIVALAGRITASVANLFGIELTPEVEYI